MGSRSAILVAPTYSLSETAWLVVSEASRTRSSSPPPRRSSQRDSEVLEIVLPWVEDESTRMPHILYVPRNQIELSFNSCSSQHGVND